MGYEDGSIALWDLSPVLRLTAILREHILPVKSLFFPSNSKWAITQCAQKTVTWNFTDITNIRRSVRQEPAHLKRSRSPDGRWTLSINDAGDLLLVDTSKPDGIFWLPKKCASRPAKWCLTNDWALICYRDGRVFLHNLADPMNCSELSSLSNKLRSRCLTPDYALLGYDNSLIRWDLSPYTKLSLPDLFWHILKGQDPRLDDSQKPTYFPEKPASVVSPSVARPSEDPLYVLALGACQGEREFADRLYERIRGGDPQIALAEDFEFQAYLASGDTAAKMNSYRIALMRYFVNLPEAACSPQELLLIRRKLLEITPPAHAVRGVSASTEFGSFVGPILAESSSLQLPHGSRSAGTSFAGALPSSSQASSAGSFSPSIAKFPEESLPLVGQSLPSMMATVPAASSGLLGSSASSSLAIGSHSAADSAGEVRNVATGPLALDTHASSVGSFWHRFPEEIQPLIGPSLPIMMAADQPSAVVVPAVPSGSIVPRSASRLAAGSGPVAPETGIVRNSAAGLLSASVSEKLTQWFRGASQVSMINETDAILRAETAARARLAENQSKAAEAARSRDQRQAELRALHEQKRPAPRFESTAAEHPFEKIRPRMQRETEALTGTKARSASATEKVLALKKELEGIRAWIADYRPSSHERAALLRAQEQEIVARKRVAIAELEASVAEERVAQLELDLRLVAIKYAQDEAAIAARTLAQIRQEFDGLSVKTSSSAKPVRPLSITLFNELLRLYYVQPTDERLSQLIAAYHHFGTINPLDQKLVDNSLRVVLKGTIKDLERQHALAQEQGRAQLEAPLRARLDRATAEASAAQGRVAELEELNATILIREGEMRLSKAETELSAALSRVAQTEQEVQVLGVIARLVRVTAADSQMEREKVVNGAKLIMGQLGAEAALTVALIAAQERVVLAEVVATVARNAHDAPPAGYYGGAPVSAAFGGRLESNQIDLAIAASRVDQAERELQDLRLVADVARSVIQLKS